MHTLSPHLLLAHRIAFSMAKGMRGDTAVEMLKRIGSPSDFCTLPPAQLMAMAGVQTRIFAHDYRAELLARAEKEALFVEHNSIRAAFRGDADYPSRLLECSDAPMMIYALGKCDLNFRRSVAIVGTRHATPYGIDFATRLVKDLAKIAPGTAIISGLAFGIDVAAHKAALSAGLPTVAVMAHGLTTIYPAEHRSVAAKIVESGGALVTEYPSDYQINRGSFLARNRIVAGLADCVVVVESDLRGGSMSTARMASDYGREVFAVPGRVNDQYSRGANRLIATNTAAMITCAGDLAEMMGWQLQPTLPLESPAPPPLPAELQAIVDFLRSNPDATINDLCVALDTPYATISDRIFRLEMADRITILPGGRFAITDNL